MIELSNLTNNSRKKIQRVGRGQGSKRGKTSCRGHKGSKSRSGYKKRHGQEGGQLPLYRKLPCRGFTNGRFKKETIALTLHMIDQLYSDGETVNLETLCNKGFISKNSDVSLKILSTGELKKKVAIEAHGFSARAKEILEKQSISFKEVPFKLGSTRKK